MYVRMAKFNAFTRFQRNIFSRMQSQNSFYEICVLIVQKKYFGYSMCRVAHEFFLFLTARKSCAGK